MRVYEIYVFGDNDNCVEDLGGGWGLFLRTNDLDIFEEYLEIALEQYPEEYVDYDRVWE